MARAADLTGSTVWVGGLSTVLTVAAALPRLFVARCVEPRSTAALNAVSILPVAALPLLAGPFHVSAGTLSRRAGNRAPPR